MHSLGRCVAAIALLCLPAPVAAAGSARAHSAAVVSTGVFTLTGEVNSPLDPCSPPPETGDSITLEGTLLIVAETMRGPGLNTIQLFTSLSGATGSGTSGLAYYAIGTVQTVLQYPPGPCTPVCTPITFHAQFDLLQIGGCTVSSVEVTGLLKFNADGTLNTTCRASQSGDCTEFLFGSPTPL